MEETFLFDDFFVANDQTDPGDRVEVEITDVHGNPRIVPLYIKRGLSLDDREAAKRQAVKTRLKPNGEYEIVSMDETVFAIELLVRCIRVWPFRYRDGSQVPVTRENIRQFLADGADKLAAMIVGRMQKRQEQKGPFLTPSALASDEA